MILYIILEAIVGIAAGILLAVITKKAEGVTYGKLDKAGFITNIVLIPIYLVVSAFTMVLAMFMRPHYDGFLAVVAWIVIVIASSAALFCGLGLGASVALRKKGKSKQSFAVQFAGAAGIALTFAIFCLFYGNLLAPLN